MEETVDPARGDKDINPDASFLHFPPPPDTKDETIIQPKIEQVVVEDLLEGDEDTDKDINSKNDAHGNEEDEDNNADNNNAIYYDGKIKINDNKVFQPRNPLP